MATTQAVATVVAVAGHAFARDAQGNLRALRPGDVLREGDVVVTSAGGRVELAFGDGTILPVEQQQTVAIHADMSETTRSDGLDAQVSGASIDKVIQALNDGGKLDDVEAPGAGLSGGGASESHDFVRLLRVAEGGNPLAFEYSTDRTSELDDRFGLASTTDTDATLTPVEPETTTPPTIEPPTTQPPTTEPPTTEPPTLEPTTQPPTIEPPTTEPPVTEPPITQPPVTLPPGGGPTLPPDGTIPPPLVTVVPPPAGIVPAAAPAGVTGTEDTDYTFTWSNFNVSDADSPLADLGIKITSLPADGTLLLNGIPVVAGQAISWADIDAGNLVFRPAPNESGSGAFGNPGVGNMHDDYAQFNFKPTDATHEGAEATMNIDITPVADMPTLDATAGAATPGGATVTYPITITSALTDTDGSETLSAPTVSSIPAGVTLSDGSGNTFTAAVGSTSVTLTGWDLTTLTLTVPAGQADFTLDVAVTSTETGGSTATATDSIFIDMPTANQPPVASPVGVTGTEDTDYTFTWSNFNVTDADSPVADLGIKITSLPADGTLLLNGVAVGIGTAVSKADIDAGKLVFRPEAHESGVDAFGGAGVGNMQSDYARFAFKPTDATSEGAAATMKIDIVPVADAPALTVSLGAAVPVPTNTATSGNITAANVFAPGNGVTVTAQKFVDLGGGNWDLSAPAAGNVIVYNASGAAILNSYGYNWIGVAGRAPGAPDNTPGSNAQIAYSYDAHQSEALIFDFGDIDVTKVSFNVDRLLFDELTSKPGNQTAVMVYELWKDGAMVFTAEIVAENNPTGEFASDKVITWAGGFDKIVFKAADHFDGMDEATSMAISKDGSDYCLTKLDYEGTRSSVGKYAYALDITSGLVDTDGSETLSAPTISNIPVGVELSDGVHTFTGAAGSSSVTLTGWDLDSLKVISADDHTDFSLVVSVRSTETANGDSAVTSRTVDVVVDGVDAIAPSVSIVGGSGEDHLVGGKGDDIITGGAGDDDLWGGLGADTFVWHLADRGAPGTPAIDTVHDFDTTANSDRLDLKDLLQGEHDTGLGFNLDKYLFVEQQGADTVVHVSSQGQFSSGFDAAKEDQRIVLQGIDLTGGLADQTQIIQQMLINGKLITDH